MMTRYTSMSVALFSVLLFGTNQISDVYSAVQPCECNTCGTTDDDFKDVGFCEEVSDVCSATVDEVDGAGICYTSAPYTRCDCRTRVGYNGKSEFTIGSFFDEDCEIRTGGNCLASSECIIDTEKECAEEAQLLGYSFKVASDSTENSVKGCFLRGEPSFESVTADTINVVWRPQTDVSKVDVDYSRSLPTIFNIDYNNARIYKCKTKLTKWEIEAVGQDSIGGKPSSIVELAEKLADGDKPFTVTTYFEAIADTEEIPKAEVFYDVPANEDDCSKGKLLLNVEGTFVRTIDVDPSTDEYTEKFKDIPGKVFPQFKNGVVRKVIVTLSDPLYESIFTADTVNSDIDGTVDFCVRISYVTNNGRLASYFDSKKKITISLTANVANFNQVVDIEKKGTTKVFETDVVKEVDVESFVCTNQNNEIKDSRVYSIGQDFRLCVGPTQAGIDAGYVVDGFNKLRCGDVELITKQDETDVLTDVDEESKNGSLGVTSVLTPDFASGYSVKCRGSVSLSYTAPGRNRRYLAPSSIEVEESLEGRFNMNVNMNSPSIESSAPPLTSVAMIGFGSILSFVIFLLI